MRLPSLAAILDSEKAKPLASSHPGKISSVPQELLKNAKKWLLPNIARFHACATGLLGQFSMKCKVVGIFWEKLVNIHFYIIWICWIQKSCLPSWILTFRSRVTKTKMATKIEVFLLQNSATYIGIMSNITTVMCTNIHKLTSCHNMYDIKYQGK